FEIANYHTAANGDFIIVGQNFNTSKEGKKFNDVLAFHFDAKGVLKSQYGIDTKENNQYSKAAGTPQFFIEKGNDMFWFLQEIKGFTATRNKVLSYPRGGKIDLANGTVSDFTIFGGKDDYYLDPKFPYLQTTKDNTLIFFGSNKSGKEIWFMRVLLK
ncbi:MAG TPA: hypothetical protein DCQ31_14900, partial [Bacteroidales bacterium]|nr:hypothetical protein [Bacteroidales bacterium]